MEAENRRNRGLDLISRINRWLISGAIAATGALAFLAANAFHGHTAHAATTPATTTAAPAPASGDDSQSVAPPSSEDSGGLSAPSSVPTPVPAAPSGPVSGGS